MIESVPLPVFWHFAAPVYKDALLYLTGIPRVQWADVAGAEWEHLRPHIRAAILRVLSECSAPAEGAS